MFNPLLVTPGECLDINETFDPSPSDLAWYYLSCTEIVHPIATNNITDMFPPENETSSADWCQYFFNVTPRVSWMPESMGMARLQDFAEQTSHLIFSNGLQDPWSAQSVTQSLSDTLVAVNIIDGSHHSDLGGSMNPVPSAGDSDTLRAAREEEIRLLREWLPQAVHARAARLDRQTVLV